MGPEAGCGKQGDPVSSSNSAKFKMLKKDTGAIPLNEPKVLASELQDLIPSAADKRSYVIKPKRL
jgi:hypothetical protein